MTADPAQAWYVYSVLPAAAGAPDSEAVLPGASIEAVAFGGLTALVSLVPRALFDRNSDAQRTQDPDWMAARIAAHHAVNAAATTNGPCLPLAFGVLFSSLERLHEWLASRASSLEAALARVAQQSEWALSIQQDAERHAAWLDRHDPALRALAEAAAGAGEGTAFLMARRREKFRASASAAHLNTIAATVTTQLTACGFAVLAEPPRAGRPSWTVLAPADAQSIANRIECLTNDLEPTGLSLRLSGPWPAYAFARLALQEGAAHG